MIAINYVYVLVAQRLKHLPAMRETWVQSLGQEDPLEKEMAPGPGVGGAVGRHTGLASTGGIRCESRRRDRARERPPDAGRRGGREEEGGERKWGGKGVGGVRGGDGRQSWEQREKVQFLVDKGQAGFLVSFILQATLPSFAPGI